MNWIASSLACLAKTGIIMLLASSNSLLCAPLKKTPAPPPKKEIPWSIGAFALYIQPSFGGNGLGYNTYSNYDGFDTQGTFVGASGATNTIYHLEPHWRFGVLVEGAYRFTPKSDLTAQWYFLNAHTNGYLPRGSLFSGNYNGLYAALLQISQHWSAANLEVGRWLLLDERKAMHLRGGLAFVDIKNQFTNYPQLFATHTLAFATQEVLTYTGFGPRVGADFGYLLFPNCNFYAKAGADVLLGSARQNTSGFQNYTNAIFGLQPYGTANFSQKHNGVVVGELDAVLGVKYDYPIRESLFSFDIGYLWITYLNAIISYSGVGIVSNVNGAGSVGTHTTANFDLNGLFLGFRWTG